MKNKNTLKNKMNIAMKKSSLLFEMAEDITDMFMKVRKFKSINKMSKKNK